MGIARNVVIEVYGVTAEGYLEGRVGSGTYVAEGIIPFPIRVPLPLRASDRSRGRQPLSMNTSLILPRAFPIGTCFHDTSGPSI